MNIPFDVIGYLVTGGAVGAALVYGLMAGRNRELAARLAMQSRNDEALANMVKAISAEALKSNNEQFLTLAQEKLANFQQQAHSNLQEREKAIEQIVKPVNDTLHKMETKIADLEHKREGAYARLTEMVGQMREQHVQLQNQTSSLVQTLRAPTSRGHWGETQLKTVLDFANLIEGVHYSRQVSAEGMRPDVVVKLPPDKVVLLDAKAPFHNYQSAMQPNVSDAEKNALLEKHAADVRTHIKKLSDKEYASGFNSFDWVVMFLPLEGLVQMALDKQPDLMEYAWSRNVVLATPTNLLALMRTVSYAHDQFKINENAKEIASLGEDIYRRIHIFADHFAKMGNALASATDKYNQALGSLERNVMSSLRKMKDSGIKADDRGVKLEAVEETPRVLTSPEFLGEN